MLRNASLHSLKYSSLKSAPYGILTIGACANSDGTPLARRSTSRVMAAFRFRISAAELPSCWMVGFGSMLRSCGPPCLIDVNISSKEAATGRVLDCWRRGGSGSRPPWAALLGAGGRGADLAADPSHHSNRWKRSMCHRFQQRHGTGCCRFEGTHQESDEGAVSSARRSRHHGFTRFDHPSVEHHELVAICHYSRS